MQDFFKNLDFRALIAIVFIVIPSLLTFASDHYTFVEKPGNVVEKIITIPTVLAFRFTEDRVNADIVGFIAFGGLTIPLICWGYMKFVRKVLEPWEARRYLTSQRRQGSWIEYYRWKKEGGGPGAL